MEEIESLVRSIALSEPVPFETALYGVIGIAVIIVGIFLSIDTVRAILKPKSLYSGQTELDSRFAHVEGRLFYSWYYFLPLIGKLGLRRDLHHIPRHKLIINHKTQKAFWFGSWSYRLLVPILKIQVASERKRFLFSRLDQWCAREHYTLIRRPAIEEDLLEGTDSTQRGKKDQELPLAQNEIAECRNCGNTWVPEPLTTLQKMLRRTVNLGYEEISEGPTRTTDCPKCGKTATVYALPKNQEKN